MRLQGVGHDFAIEQEQKHVSVDLMKLIILISPLTVGYVTFTIFLLN